MICINVIDRYHYCSDKDKEKEKYYREHKLTEKEQQKTDEFHKKMEDYVIKTNGENGLSYYRFEPEGSIEYREELGYISVGNFDRDEVTVFSYGKTIDEAFFNATINFEFNVYSDYELHNRQNLNKQYSERFLDGNYSEDDYHGPFFWSEFALQDFRKYYGDAIPEEIISNYENYLEKIGEGSYKYDYVTNSLVPSNKKVKQLKSKTTKK